MFKKIYPAIIASSATFPLLALAQAAGGFGDPAEINTRLNTIISTLQIIIGILFIIATIVFLWGMIMYISNSDDEAKREKAKGIMTWGIIGLAVMAVAWGITTILINYFGVPNAPPTFVPYPAGPGGPGGAGG